MDPDPPQPPPEASADGAVLGAVDAAVWPYLVLALCALLLNLFFTMSQTAVAAIGAHARVGAEREDPPYPNRLHRLLGRLPALEQQFSAASLVMLLVMGLALVRWVVGWLPGEHTAAVLLGTVLAAALQFFVVELFGRHLVFTIPLGISLWLVPLTRWLALPFLPLSAVARGLGSYYTKPAPPGQLTDMHLRLLPNLSGIERVLDEEAFDMIDSVREFAEMTAEDIMTPRTEVEGLPDNLPAADVYDRLRRSEFSRLAVYSGTLDSITGTLLAKEVLLQRPKDPYSLLRRPIVVNETMRLPELLGEIRRHRTHLLVVEDEYGGVSGIVTLHDLFEVLVGHIEDVEDEEESWIESTGEGTYRLDGRVELWEANEELGLALDEEVARTIGGYVVNTLGRVPKAGDTVDCGAMTLRVLEMDKARVEAIEVEPRSPDEPSDSPGEAAE